MEFITSSPQFKKYNFEAPLPVQIRKQITSALADFHMIQEGDRVMVAVSGGKDSSILTLLLSEIQKRAPFQFSMEAVMLDQMQPGFDASVFAEWIESLGIPFTLIKEDTYSIVKEKIPEGKTYCSLCSRLRRGILYNYAFEKGFHKIALGHHRDDLIETVLMNMFYSGKIASMPPKLKSDDGRNILIRPLAYVSEDDLIKLSKEWAFPVIPCKLCGSQDGAKRQYIRNLLKQMETQNPQLKATLFNSLTNIEPSQMLDAKIWDFKGI